MRRQLWTNARDGDYQSACDALVEAGLGDFVGPRFNTNTLSAWVREQGEAGESPEEIAARLPGNLAQALSITESFKLVTRAS